MNKNKIDHIFFDLDHTLWDFDKNSNLAFERLFSRFKMALDIKDFIEVYDPINLAYWKLYRDDKVTSQELRRGRLTDTFKTLGYSFETSLIDQLSEEYIIELPSSNYLFEGTVELLEYLKPNYKLHIITNGFEKVQNKKLRNSGIHHFFETVTNSEIAGVKKPNPKIFNLALKQAKALPENSVMIGDNLEADIFGAKQVGFFTIFLIQKVLKMASPVCRFQTYLKLKISFNNFFNTLSFLRIKPPNRYEKNFKKFGCYSSDLFTLFFMY